jgi:hypothetical protein
MREICCAAGPTQQTEQKGEPPGSPFCIWNLLRSFDGFSVMPMVVMAALVVLMAARMRRRSMR